MANLFPEDIEEDWTEDEAENSTSEEVTFGRSWRFDFEAGDFVMTPTRKVAAADETAAWVIWCEKAIRTPRYRHLIYSREHGEEFDDLIGRGYSRAVQESEIQRIVIETLLVDPRTASVGDFTFSWREDACYFTCRISNVRDEEAVLEGSVG
ncbi:hypothetical protein J41TS12_10560 [Paenibacillus antibioticophila]|uniref:DUF2634 domain-containing protein n=1 Tax=Paenibacillus antibioticophila TaxID=1274374 RepID=A0A919XSQ0_9BACL|nr:DUF2634 domain-containing protein [Paenibacillus antibioticophila]GIO36195.1 hypothetical protein J41TS12_10560 [Paenibacillus antibioticophila]